MHPKTRKHNWPSTSQIMEFQQILATEWFFEFWQHQETYDDGPKSAWLSTLVESKQLVVNTATDQLVLVLAKGSYGFFGWSMKVVKEGELSLFQPVKSASMKVFHVTNLEDWLVVPYRPVLAGPKGPLCLEQSGQAMELPYALIEVGLKLTAGQCKDLLTYLKVDFKKNASKAVLYDLLLDVYLETAEDKQKAQQKIKEASQPLLQEDSDAELEELLEHIEDADNKGDPDLKKEKEKIKDKKRKKIVTAAKQDFPKPGAKAKAKSRAKAKAKSRMPLKRKKWCKKVPQKPPTDAALGCQSVLLSIFL